jgi:periplasmic copper chaperone A
LDRVKHEDRYQPGEFREFPLSVLIPGKAGQTLTFKALQTYSNGTIVRWIGAPGSREPAPQLKLTSASTSGAAASGSGGQAKTSAPAPAASADNDSNGLSIVAAVLGALGLLIAVAALVVARRGAAGPGR